ncbi:FCD domain-containing protein [Brevibacterium sp. HMSC063G07]|uniref:FCD domain-containing protein n=1 Tax=Brevibacterium sp. HMSC063G07 TaxID=1739261 RepID=UPI0008A45AF6|nr:FCD domain-containing protein [Brevibacterium sp. HMSC063G07]OFL67594.1 hypothetical protein HMPREF2757_10020 [Brevibacterium sp. HMSC063G07]
MEQADRQEQEAQRARIGRPEKQSRANRAVARALALAGRDVVGQVYGTRGLAEELGLSQTLVSRACRWLEGAPDGEASGSVGTVAKGVQAAAGNADSTSHADTQPACVFIDEIRVEDSRLTLIFRTGESAIPDGPEVGTQKVRPSTKTADASGDSARTSEASSRPEWGSVNRRRRGWAFLAALRQWSDRELFSIHIAAPDGSAQVRQFDDFDAFAGAVAGVLVRMGGGQVSVQELDGGLAWVRETGSAGVPGAGGVPFDVLEFLADAVAADVNTFFWRRPIETAQSGLAFDSLSGASGSAGTPAKSDRESQDPVLHPWREVGDSVWRRTLVAELEADLRERSLQAGDQVSVRHLALRMGVAQKEIVRGLGELQMNGVLERAGNVFRLPVVSGESVLDLYAARYAVGVVVLRGASAGRASRQSTAGRTPAGASGTHKPTAGHPSPSQRTVSQSSVRGAVSRAEQAKGSLHIADRALSRLEEDDSLGPRSVDRLDLQFQQGLAEASGLEHTADVFDSLGQRLRLLIAILRVDYEPAAAKIRSDNAAILAAVRKGRADQAIAVWRSKIENAVRHMSSVAGLRRFDVAAWQSLVE